MNLHQAIRKEGARLAQQGLAFAMATQLVLATSAPVFANDRDGEGGHGGPTTGDNITARPIKRPCIPSTIPLTNPPQPYTQARLQVRAKQTENGLEPSYAPLLLTGGSRTIANKTPDTRIAGVSSLPAGAVPVDGVRLRLCRLPGQSGAPLLPHVAAARLPRGACNVRQSLGIRCEALTLGGSGDRRVFIQRAEWTAAACRFQHGIFGRSLDDRRRLDCHGFLQRAKGRRPLKMLAEPCKGSGSLPFPGG
jgi:hypothetical protein